MRRRKRYCKTSELGCICLWAASVARFPRWTQFPAHITTTEAEIQAIFRASEEGMCERPKFVQIVRAVVQ